MSDLPRKWIFAGVTLLVTLLTIACGTEILFRVSGFEPFRSHDADSDEPVIFQPHPTLGWVHKEGLHLFPPFSAGTKPVPMRFLADGSRATGPGVASSPGPTLLLLGGSFTEGFALPDEETFGWKLQEHYPEWRVKNFGTGGYGTFQSLLMLEEQLATDDTPGLVIYAYYGEHDVRNVAAPGWLEALTRFSRRHADVALPYATLDNGVLLRHTPARYNLWSWSHQSAALTFLQTRWERLIGRRRVDQQREVTERLMLEMSRRTHAERSTFLVVFLLADRDRRVAYQQTLDEAEIPWVDCFRRFTPALRVPGDGHPNGKLNSMWSRCIAAAADELLAGS